MLREHRAAFLRDGMRAASRRLGRGGQAPRAIWRRAGELGLLCIRHA